MIDQRQQIDGHRGNNHQRTLSQQSTTDTEMDAEMIIKRGGDGINKWDRHGNGCRDNDKKGERDGIELSHKCVATGVWFYFQSISQNKFILSVIWNESKKNRTTSTKHNCKTVRQWRWRWYWKTQTQDDEEKEVNGAESDGDSDGNNYKFTTTATTTYFDIYYILQVQQKKNMNYK